MPAIINVNKWISADTRVGAAIAADNHPEYHIYALFVITITRSPSHCIL